MQTPNQKPELKTTIFANVVSNLVSFLSGMEQLFGKFCEPFGLSLLRLGSDGRRGEGIISPEAAPVKERSARRSFPMDQS